MFTKSRKTSSGYSSRTRRTGGSGRRSSKGSTAASESRAAIFDRPLWTCPRCGNRFVNRNSWHSCGRWPLDSHFEGRPRARELFARLHKELKRFGPVTIVSSKTRITFMTRVRFVNVTVRSNYLRCGLWFTQRIDDPRFVRIEKVSPRAWGHEFLLRDESEFTPALRKYLAEAYAIGRQEHLR